MKIARKRAFCSRERYLSFEFEIWYVFFFLLWHCWDNRNIFDVRLKGMPLKKIANRKFRIIQRRETQTNFTYNLWILK